MDSKTCSQNIKNVLTNLYLHIWLLSKTWLYFLMDDFEKDYKIENHKINH